MDFETLARVHLREGAGGGASGDGFCVMELVSWISGEDRITDQPDCASPHLTSFAIALNDSAPTGHVRDSMKPLAFLLIGTRDARNEQRRADYLRRQCARVLLPVLIVDAGLNSQTHRLHAANTKGQMIAAARDAESALKNVTRSHTSENARAATARLAEACGIRNTQQALRDCVYCILIAPTDPELKFALWRKAHAILRVAIGLGKCESVPPASIQGVGAPVAGVVA
jgi:hypothetical protein